MIKCREVTDIHLANDYEKLSLFKKIQFRFHLLICGPCKKFVAFGNIISKGIKSIYAQNEKISHKSIDKIKSQGKSLLEKRKSE